MEKRIKHKGIVIERTSNTQFDKNSIKGKIFNSISFFVGALWLVLKKEGKHPMILVTNPPFLGLVGVICKIFKRQSYILIVHDLYPDIAVNVFLWLILWRNRGRWQLCKLIQGGGPHIGGIDYTEEQTGFFA